MFIFFFFYKNYLNILQEYSQIFKLRVVERLHVGIVDGTIFLAVGANILIDKVRFALQYTNAFPMEPVLAFIATNIKPEIDYQSFVLIYTNYRELYNYIA